MRIVSSVMFFLICWLYFLSSVFVNSNTKPSNNSHFTVNISIIPLDFREVFTDLWYRRLMAARLLDVSLELFYSSFFPFLQQIIVILLSWDDISLLYWQRYVLQQKKDASVENDIFGPKKDYYTKFCHYIGKLKSSCFELLITSKTSMKQM